MKTVCLILALLMSGSALAKGHGHVVVAKHFRSNHAAYPSVGPSLGKPHSVTAVYATPKYSHHFNH